MTETKLTSSPKKAIASHCKGCVYDSQSAGNWRQQVEACTITNCELYEHRPLTAKTRRFNNETRLAMLTQEQREIVEIRNSQRTLNMLNLRNAKQGSAHIEG